jgi:ABC-type multidrug transport system fused ATPase/permease subunit
MIRTVNKKCSEVKDAFKIFWGFLKYLRKHRIKIIILATIILLTSVFGSITPLLGKIIVDNAIPNQNWSIFYIIALGYLAVSLIIQGINIFQAYLSLCLQHEVRASLSITHFRNLLSLPFAEIQQKQAGAQIFRATSDVNAVVGLVTTFFTGIAHNIVSLFIAVGIMFSLNWKVTSIYIVLVPFVFLLRLYISLKIRPLQKDLREHNESVSAFLGQTFSGTKIIKIFGMETYESLKYLRLLRENIRLNFRIWTAKTIFGRVQWFFESGVGSCLQWWIWFLVMKRYTSLGSAMAISWYFSMIVGPFMGLAGSVQKIIAGMVPGERVFETLHSEKEPLHFGQKTFETNNGYTIRFRDVSFSYSKDNEVLKNIFFELQPGTITALIGPSGSGKTTIINLICALYPFSNGTVELNNTRINKLATSSLRSLISLVPQDPFILRTSIMDNIRYSDRHSTENEVFEAARMAHIHEKIISLPEGYETILKKDRNDFSIGEQQRITIARAFLRKSPIVIFDEAFSNLDMNTECKIMNSLKSLKYHNKTILVVSHRLKNMIFADNIIVIREGSIAESGSPEELMKKKGIFFELFESSTTGNIIQSFD